MKIKYIDVGFIKTTWELLNKINDIIENFSNQGYTLTLRQLYYQLVAMDVIPNKVSEYGKISRILNKARLGGIVDWDAIEDRLRVPYLPYSADSLSDALGDLQTQFRFDRLKPQKVYIELWCEKDAISSILKRAVSKYHVRVVVNRGYASVTSLYDATNRFKRSGKEQEQINILYLGDHDPSGLDMVRDIKNRLGIFGYDGIAVKHIALTTKQIEKYKPPPNPAKLTDPRANNYIEIFGNTSWEVDALTPTVFDALIKNEIEKLIDIEILEGVIKKENKAKDKIQKLVDEENN